MLSTMKKRSLILKGVVQLRCLGLCRGNSLCMTCSGMFGAGARPRTRLLRRLHEKTSFGQDLQDYQDYKSPKTLAHCKNLENPVNPVKKDTSWGEELQLAYSWSREVQIQSAGTYGTVYV